MLVKSQQLTLAALLFFLMVGSVIADPFTDLGIDVPKVRMDAPAFTLEKLHGGKASLADYKGKVILLNFWATWCGPCRHEMPGMQKLWERYREQGFVIIAVATDKDGKRQVAPFVEKLGLTYPVLLDPDGKTRNHYEVVGLPTSYLIGRDGKISGRVIGIIEWNSDEANVVVASLLAQHSLKNQQTENVPE